MAQGEVTINVEIKFGMLVLINGEPRIFGELSSDRDVLTVDITKEANLEVVSATDPLKSIEVE